MAHRALQILTAAAAAIAARSSLGATVFVHRDATLSAPDNELPAICVQAGADQPIGGETGATNLAFYDSAFEIVCVAIAVAVGESELIDELFRLRSEIHLALRADTSIGLAFVMDTQYMGAAVPTIDAAAENMVGRLETYWRVLYRMATIDPN